MNANSYIVRNKLTKNAVFETFEEDIVNTINTDTYEVVSAIEHLMQVSQLTKGGRHHGRN